MATRFDLVTLDARDTEELARFWSATLSLHEVEREDDGRWIVLGDASSNLRRLGLQRITGLNPEPAVFEGGRKARLHLDLACEPHEFDSEMVRLVGLGAQPLRAARREVYGSIATMADPEGNVFDLCAYQEKS
jgi:catechol 2,3-dioxygenase-like lactoylglutathione lyase family enzyme